MWQPATQPPSHVAVAITLNAKASSLKMIQQETQLSLTNRATHLEFSQGHHNTVRLHMLSMVSYYSAVIILSLRYAPFFRYSTSKNVGSLKSWSEVTQCHWKWYHSIDWVWFPISVPTLSVRQDIRLQKCRDLETRVSGPSRSLIASPSQCSTVVRTVVRVTQQVNGKWQFWGCQNSVTPEPID